MPLFYSSLLPFLPLELVEKYHTLIIINKKYFWSKIKPYSFDGSLSPTQILSCVQSEVFVVRMLIF